METEEGVEMEWVKKKLQQMGEMCGQGADPEFCEREGIQNFLTSKKKKIFSLVEGRGGLKLLRGHNAHFKVNPVPPPLLPALAMIRA